MEVYKYILLVFAGYMAVCAAFSKIGMRLPICLDVIFGSQISFLMKYIVVFGFIWWAGSEIYKRYIKKEGYATKASAYANANTESKYGDQSDANTIYDEFLKNAEDIPENPHEELLKNAKDIPSGGPPKGFYSIKIYSMSNGSVISENKMLSTKYMPKNCKYNEATKSIEAKNLSDTIGCNGQYYTFFNNTFDNVPDGYYGITINSKNAAGNTVSTKKMMSAEYMPDGCKPSGKLERGIVPVSPTGNYKTDQEKCRDIFDTFGSGNEMKYDADNLDKYATNVEKTGAEKEKLQKKNFDVNLKIVNPPPIYYEPGSYTFGTTGYVPDYERSIYLSKTTNMSQVDDITAGAPYLEGGFCTQYANSPQNMEQKCQSLDNQTCASTNCCVLLGGKKCVSGDSQGPKIKANYSDTQILNRDYYYYQGKCFGNCGSNNSSQATTNAFFKSEEITPAGKLDISSLVGSEIAGKSPAGKSPAGKSPSGKSPAGKSPAGKKKNTTPAGETDNQAADNEDADNQDADNQDTNNEDADNQDANNQETN